MAAKLYIDAVHGSDFSVLFWKMRSLKAEL